VHLYKVISTRCYIALTEIIKVSIGSLKMAQNECAPKVIQEVNFPKHLCSYYAHEGM